jgi:hypothetical protein
VASNYHNNYCLVAQLVEQRTVNPWVAGSSPAEAAKKGAEASMVMHWTVNSAPMARLVRSQDAPPDLKYAFY